MTTAVIGSKNEVYKFQEKVKKWLSYLEVK
jgi:hypothetical protein